MARERSLDWYETQVRTILPLRAETALLQACLGTTQHAQDAWRDFLAHAGEPKAYFEAANGALKGLLPFVESSLRRNEIEASPAFLTHARVAAVREELRDQICRDVLCATVDALRGAGIRPLLLRGLGVAIACYPVPRRRHNHGIDLMLDANEIQPAVDALVGIGCRPVLIRVGSSHRAFVHSTGLPIVLHASLFELPHLVGSIEALRARSVEVAIDGRSIALPSSAHHLLHICGHASYSPSRRSLRWICDAVQLIRSDPMLDWSLLISAATKARLALPMSVVLRYLREQMHADVPETVIARLRCEHRLSDPLVREAIHAMRLERAAVSVHDRRARPDIASLLSFLRFRLAPSRQYVAWKYGVVGAPAIAACYAGRPIRFVLRRFAHVLRTQARVPRDRAAVNATR